MTAVERDPSQLFAKPRVELERRADGTMLMRSPYRLEAYDRCVGNWLVHWAEAAPDRHFLLERGASGNWQGVTYAEAHRSVRRIGAWLLAQNLSIDRPVAILSDNSVEHALVALASMHVAIPVVPISSAYALISKDYAKLKSIMELIRPNVIYVSDAERFAPVLAAVSEFHDGRVVVGSGQRTPLGMTPFAELLGTHDDGSVDRAFATVGPETIAKLLFTSGSTGIPKGVQTTQRMLCANQQQIRQLWPFLKRDPPVVVDWLPWSHTFGGSHNFNLVLHSGGTLYIDGGRPAPGLFERTVANLREIAPTIYFNVPRGFDMLVTALRADEALRRHFFSRLQVIFYAAAAIPQHVWEALETLARDTTGEPIVLVSAWGSTETAPLATSCHYRAERAGVIGLPIPGCELKLVPCGEKLEARVRGPNVTLGYWKQPEITRQAFDDEGFYRIGDAVRLVDMDHPERGIQFDGRIAEDFKLATGTWVNSGGLRINALAALAPIVQDIVVAGHDRDEIGFLLVPNLIACRKLCDGLSAEGTVEQVLAHDAVRERVRRGLKELRQRGTGSSTHATRALLMAEPLSIDGGEITDKGYINQGAVLARRRQLVEQLYASSPAPEVIMLRDD